MRARSTPAQLVSPWRKSYSLRYLLATATLCNGASIASCFFDNPSHACGVGMIQSKLFWCNISLYWLFWMEHVVVGVNYSVYTQKDEFGGQV